MTSETGSTTGETAGTLGRVTIATIIAAASGYLVLLIAARHLGAAGYGVFAVFWAAYGMVTGAQNGQLQETTRAIRSARGSKTDVPQPLMARPIRVNAVIGLALGVAVAVTAPLWSGQVFTTQRWMSVILLAIGVISFAVYAHLCGALAGAASWTAFATLLSADALIRLAGALIAILAGWGLDAFLIITVIGSVSWCALLASSGVARRAVGLRGDVPARRLSVNTLTAMTAAAASAVLVMGLPVLIKLTSELGLFGAPSDDERVVGALILAVTLTRAPLLVPLNSFQGVLITRFVEARHRLAGALAAPLLVVAGVGAFGSLLAWVLGPWLLGAVFGADFRLGGGAVAALTVGATFLALLTVTGSAAIAVGGHRWYAAGWWVATLVSVVVLTLPADVTVRVGAALVVGPLAGVVVHLAGLRAAR